MPIPAPAPLTGDERQLPAAERKTLEPFRRSGRRRAAFRLALFSIVLTGAIAHPGVEPASAVNPRPAVGTQFHCVWAHYTPAKRRAVLNKLWRAGVRWVRIDVGWWGVEPHRRGSFHLWYLRQLDACVGASRRRGMRVLATFWGSPGWANGGRTREAEPIHPSDYANAARRLAARYRGRVAAWEIWNEPDPGNGFWLGSVAQYALLLRTAYPAIKAGDPSALVVVGGPSSNDAGWVNQLYLLGIKGSFDVMATHGYQGIADAPPERRSGGERWWFSNAPAVHAVMARFGDGAKRIWFTEFGWSAHRDRPGIQNWRRGVTRRQQARYLVRAIKYARRRMPMVRVMFWYKERAFPGGRDAHLEGYALMSANLTGRPALRALRAYLRTP